MNGTNLDLRFPAKLMNTIQGLRNSTPDRGMKLASIVIGLESKRNEEEATRAAEEFAKGLMNGHKIDQVV